LRRSLIKCYNEIGLALFWGLALKVFVTGWT